MLYPEVNSVLSKIDDCDFEGAVSEMYRLSRQFSENGSPEYSDFLAHYASSLRKPEDFLKDAKPYSKVVQELNNADEQLQALVMEVDEIVIQAFAFFKQMESIAVSEYPYRPPRLGMLRST
ncbi:hypothetical protein, partial [Pseudomonas putida]|uniref:hypothetical protein n=1 Tax=Pseudomonas putida TaxID=303 RepID=UPI00111C8436